MTQRQLSSLLLNLSSYRHDLDNLGLLLSILQEYLSDSCSTANAKTRLKLDQCDFLLSLIMDQHEKQLDLLSAMIKEYSANCRGLNI